MSRADLLACLLRNHASAWADTAQVPSEDLFNAAVDHGVHPLLAWRLRQDAAARAVCPKPTRRLFEEALRAEAAFEQVQRRELRRVLDALFDAGADPILFKGAGLAFTHYAHPVLRPRLDADLLVRPAEVPDAARTLERLAYRAQLSITAELLNSPRPAEQVERFKASSQIAYARTDAFGLHHECDLHWHPSIPHVFAPVLTWDALDRDAVAVPELGPRARAFGAVHALTLACIHRVAHHHGSEHLLWLYDIHLMVERLSPDEADAFVRLAASTRISGVCLAGVAAAEGRFETRMPDRLGARLDDDAARDPAAPSAAYLRAHLRKVDVLRADLAALDRWRDKAALVWDHVVPPRGYIEKTYDISTPALLPFLYARRLFGNAWKWFRAA